MVDPSRPRGALHEMTFEMTFDGLLLVYSAHCDLRTSICTSAPAHPPCTRQSHVRVRCSSCSQEGCRMGRCGHNPPLRVVARHEKSDGPAVNENCALRECSEWPGVHVRTIVVHGLTRIDNALYFHHHPFCFGDSPVVRDN